MPPLNHMVTNSTPVPYAGNVNNFKFSNRIRDKYVENKHIKGPAFVVIEQKSQVKQTGMDSTEKPDVPFAGQFFLVNHDPRLTLSDDTYVQLTMAAGFKVKVRKKGIDKKVQDWLETVNFEKKLEDGLHSYFQCGNMLFEHEKHFANLEEVDMATVMFADREKSGPIKEYITLPDMMDEPIKLKPDEVVHFKLTNVRKEAWGRGLFHSLFSPRFEGDLSEIEKQWQMESDMVKIFKGYASPMMMINFQDAGPEWMEAKKTEFAKLQAGAKILTDKEFNAQVFEVNGAAKFDGYVDHRQTNLIEPGSQFAQGFFTADFTNRNAAEITDSMLGRKIKRIQKRLAGQIKTDIIMKVVHFFDKTVKSEDVEAFFELESKSEIGNLEVMALFEKGGITRSELRRHLLKKTTIEVDAEDMNDTPPITSVTPTNDQLTSQPSPAAAGMTGQDQRAALAQLQKSVERLESKIPNPRGRPKKE